MPPAHVLAMARKLAELLAQNQDLAGPDPTSEEVLAAARKVAEDGEPIEVTLARMISNAREELREQQQARSPSTNNSRATRDTAQPRYGELTPGGCMALLFLAFSLCLLFFGLR